MSNFDLTTFDFVSDPSTPAGDVLAAFGIEPSAVDRLAAIEDPDGEAGQRVKEWENLKEAAKNIGKLSDMIYEKTQRGPNWMRVSPKVMHSVLGGTQVTC